MKRSSPQHRLLIGIAALGAFLLPLAPTAATMDQHDQEITRYRIQIGQLREEITSHLNKIKETGQKERSVLDELAQLDQRVAQQQDKLQTLKERLQAQEQLLVLKERDLEQAQVVKENIRKHLQKRLRSFYLMGKTGFLNVAFATDNLPELMKFNDSFRQLLSYDQSVIEMYHETIEQLRRATEARKLEKGLLEEFIAQSSEEKKTLDGLRRDKAELLARIQAEKEVYEQALVEMQKAESNLTVVLMDLKTKKMLKSQEFMLSRGKLSAPVPGRVIRRFKEKIAGAEIENAIIDGITIETAESTPVQAIFSGKVLYSGYMRGYGNMLIIEHGLQYYSVTARMDKIFKKENDQVSENEVIGVSGGMANLFTKGLYFEIRRGSDALDPLGWLKPDAFAATAPEPLQAAAAVTAEPPKE